MKKRLPSIFVIGGALLTGLIIFLWPYINPPVDKSDKDGDGFDDKIDQCVDVASNTNMGCPEKQYLGIDKDRDGLFAGFQKDATLSDKNDNNACIPNDTCSYCDSDGDGTPNKLDLCDNKPGPTKFKGCPAPITLPDADDDGDGIPNSRDRCPDIFGIALYSGCLTPKNEGNKDGTSKITNITLNPSLQKIEWEGDIPEIKVKINLGGTKSFTCIVKKNSSIELTRDQKKDILHCMGNISLSYYDSLEEKDLPIRITNGSRIHCYNLFKE